MTTHNSPTENIRFLRLPIILERTGLSRSTIYKYIADGNFPKQISLGNRASAWVESEVDAWMKKQIELSRKTTPVNGSVNY